MNKSSDGFGDFWLLRLSGGAEGLFAEGEEDRKRGKQE